MNELTVDGLVQSALDFCQAESGINHPSLVGVNDGKSVGTYIEQKFKDFLSTRFMVDLGSSAKGIDLPGEGISTDIKVTSINQPQSSCPFRSARQKIFGLGYNLLVFVYEKQDLPNQCYLAFKHLAFIDKAKTADYTITYRLREMIADHANKADIIGYLQDRNIPGDEIVYEQLAEEILSKPLEQGYLTISNALQWRLNYSRAIALNNKVQGVINHDC